MVSGICSPKMEWSLPFLSCVYVFNLFITFFIFEIEVMGYLAIYILQLLWHALVHLAKALFNSLQDVECIKILRCSSSS